VTNGVMAHGVLLQSIGGGGGVGGDATDNPFGAMVLGANFGGDGGEGSDGDTVTVGEQTLEVIHCPGHTPGHVVFLHRETQLAWVGDVIFAGSIGRTDFPMGNHEQLIHSIREKLFPIGDDIRFVPGHGPDSTFGQERVSNPFVADKHYG